MALYFSIISEVVYGYSYLAFEVLLQENQLKRLSIVFDITFFASISFKKK